MSAIVTKNLNKEFKRYIKQDNFLHNFFLRKYETKRAVSNLNLVVEEGEILGLLGQNGAGKTTTMKMLAGLMTPTSGEVTVLGYKPFNKEKAYKKKIALLLGQKQQLWTDICAMDNFKLFKDIYELDDKFYKENLYEMVEMLQVENIVNSPVRTLSLGEKMKCELIASLIHGPKVLFLDEPTIGLDLVSQKKIRKFIKDYTIAHGATVIITSHNMNDIEELCDRTVFIDKGKKYFDGKLSDFVGQYGQDCILNVDFKSEYNIEQFVKYGEITKKTEHLIKIRVPKQHSNQIRKEIVKNDNVLSVIQEELEASEIVRDYFISRR